MMCDEIRGYSQIMSSALGRVVSSDSSIGGEGNGWRGTEVRWGSIDV